MKRSLFDIFKKGVIDENPAFAQALGMCPLLAVTTSAVNGLGMGVATTAVLVCSNFFISLIRGFIPKRVRIPCFIIVIASFVTMVDLFMKAYAPPSLNAALGIFIQLIVVNCLILARAESFASKNNPVASLIDGLGMGLGFTLALCILGSVRELIGAGTVFGFTILPDAFPKTIVMILPPGAFITLGFLMALYKYIQTNKGRAAK